VPATQKKTPGVPSTARKKRWGCLFWGCLTSLFLTLIGTTAVGLLAYRFLTRQVQEYTADAAVVLPEVDYSAADLAQLEQRLRLVDQQDVAEQDRSEPIESISASKVQLPATTVQKSKSDERPGPGDLVLSARDINALIGQNPLLRGKLFVTIEEGKIGGEVSIPIPGVPGGEGRFFNASATFNVSISDDQLFVTVADAYVKGEQAPKFVIDAIAGENLARDINQHPRMKPRLEKFDSISIEDDNVILRAKTKADTSGTQDEQQANTTEPATS
jgi:hypothetical protein